jgi:universal stress protein A
MPSIQVVLHPSDFSELSQHAAAAACRIARAFQARLVIVHVVPTGSTELATIMDMGVHEETEGVSDSYLRYLHDIRLPDTDVPVEYRLEDGDPAAVIVRLAREIPADLIVMGTHGRKALGHLLLGSVAEHVIRHAPCPVLTIRGPAFGDAGTA